jgi:O-antigen ligase
MGTVKAFLLIFPFFPIGAIDYGRVYDVLMFADIFVIFALVAFRNDQIRLRPQNILIFLFMVWLSLACVKNGKSPVPGLFYGGKLVTFIFLNEYYLMRRSLTLLQVTKNYMTFLILVTTFFQFVSQGIFGTMEVSGNYRNFFVGDNELGYYCVAYLSLCIVLDMIDQHKIGRITAFMTLVCIASLLRTWSGKSLVGIAAVFVYLIFVYGKKIAKVLNFVFLAGTYISIYIGIVGFEIQFMFSDFITNVLHKDATLTGRTYIWASVLKNIRESPIWGHGTVDGGQLIINYSHMSNLVSSHNLFMEVILQTGIVGLVLYLGYIGFSLSRRTRYLHDEAWVTYFMLLFFTFVILIMYITTPTIYLVFAYLPIVLCANLDKLFHKSVAGTRWPA